MAPFSSSAQNLPMTNPSLETSSDEADSHSESHLKNSPATASNGAPADQSRRTWNYRVMSFEHGEEAWQAIHEVYYSGGIPSAYTSTPAVVMWDTADGGDAALRVLGRMREALLKPVLTESDFPGADR